MLASEYIAILQALVAEHGDLEVNTLRHNGERTKPPKPALAYCGILRGRERNARFWQTWDDEELRGEKVIRL
jgi:hypothetical protein